MMKLLIKILQFYFGLYFALLSLVFLFKGGKALIGALILFLSSLIVLPFTRKFIENKLNYRLNQTFKYSVPFLAIILPWFFLDLPEIEKPQSIEHKTISHNLKDTSDTSINTIAKDSIHLDTIKVNESIVKKAPEQKERIISKPVNLKKNKKKTISHVNTISSKPKSIKKKRKRKPRKRRRKSTGRVYHRGPRGGCFYYTSSGNKVYVDRSICN